MQHDFPVGKPRLKVGQARQQAPVGETRKAPDGQRYDAIPGRSSAVARAIASKARPIWA